MAVQKEHARYLAPHEEAQYLTLKEAAALTDYTPDYIGQLIRAGKIEGFQVYTNVSWVTTEKAVQAYIATRGKQESDTVEVRSFFANPQRFMRGALYGVIGCLVVLLCVLLYILSVSIDRAVTNASLEKFNARTTH